MSTKNSNMPGEPMVPESVETHPAWFRLVDQQNWYDSKSQHCQRWYKRLKIMQVTLAVLIPSTSLLPTEYAKWAASIAGILIAVLEAVQQMNQYSTLWVTYRATAERLKHEQYLFLSNAGPYKGLAETDRLIALAERVEEHVSTEHANWFNETRRSVVAKTTDRKE
ncbi:MAG: DUF4231 domain-containing protein [Desulfovibrionaceae bacterium]|nr:DUF4231 domain-containing protein [Desulfovibrionaceae bacterium]